MKMSDALRRHFPLAAAVAAMLVLAAPSLGGEPSHAGKESEAEGKGKKPNAARRFVQLDPLIIPIIENNRVKYRVSLEIVLEMQDPTLAALVEQKLPRLIGSYQRDLYGILSGPWPEGVVRIDAEKIKERLFRRTVEVVGAGTVRQVLLNRILEMRG